MAFDTDDRGNRTNLPWRGGPEPRSFRQIWRDSVAGGAFHGDHGGGRVDGLRRRGSPDEHARGQSFIWDGRCVAVSESGAEGYSC
jgi:hypothetical protein